MLPWTPIFFTGHLKWKIPSCYRVNLNERKENALFYFTFDIAGKPKWRIIELFLISKQLKHLKTFQYYFQK